MFGVDRSHVAQGRGDPAGKAKPYSGPTDPVGWLATAARHALSHHHPESFAPHLLVKLCGPKRTVAVATGAAAGRAAFAAARGPALSLCYVMHADWFNDVCGVDVDAKNKPERPLRRAPAARRRACSSPPSTGPGPGRPRAPEPAAARRRGLRRHGRRRLPLLGRPPADAPPHARRAAAGPGAGLLGIYAAFDALMYVEACGARASPRRRSPPTRSSARSSGPPPPRSWNLALLVAKDLGGVPGDAAAGLRTLPAAAGRPERGVPRACLPGPSGNIAWTFVNLTPRHRRRGPRGQRVGGVGRPGVISTQAGTSPRDRRRRTRRRLRAGRGPRAPGQRARPAPALLLGGLALGYYAAVGPRPRRLAGERSVPGPLLAP